MRARFHAPPLLSFPIPLSYLPLSPLATSSGSGGHGVLSSSSWKQKRRSWHVSEAAHMGEDLTGRLCTGGGSRRPAVTRARSRSSMHAQRRTRT
uniref:Uncharacterized protein n=1 Tax=Oryza sativa subsp. japonica TaxID=39947 RepID=Q5Z8U1_ORYSJ|nr:hypothetical protein [Oryza sativa Japonica Group]BAD53813.1 hypothetical protein [Oryza sativa Japonica Group]